MKLSPSVLDEKYQITYSSHKQHNQQATYIVSRALMEVLVNSHVIVAAHVCFCLISTECLCRCPPSIASSKFLSHNMDIHQEVCLRKYSQLFEKPPIYYLRQMCSIGFFFLPLNNTKYCLSLCFLLPSSPCPSHTLPFHPTLVHIACVLHCVSTAVLDAFCF